MIVAFATFVVSLMLSDQFLGVDITDPPSVIILIGNLIAFSIAFWIIINLTERSISRLRRGEDIWLLFEFMAILGEAGEKAEKLRNLFRLVKSKEVIVGFPSDQ